MPGPAADNVVAVIVTLDPEAYVIQNAESLVGRVRRVVVIDNGSGQGAASILDALSLLPSVDVVRNAVNMGIGRALNQGVRAAEDDGATWLLTLDQDAAPGPDIVRIAGETFAAVSWQDRIAVIGSASDADLVRRGSAAGSGRLWAETSAVITAGSFVSLIAVDRIGDFREDFFVDYVDIEFCLRARARGYRVVESGVVAMTHRIGRPTARQIGPRAVTPTNHSVMRRYYITRNRFLVWRRYWRSDARFVAADAIESQKELAKLLLFEEHRPAKVRATLAGLRDGIRNVTGEKRAPRH